MELLLRAKIDCDLDTFKNNLMKSSSLNYICYPLLVFKPIDRDALPTIWTEDNFKVKMYFLGFIPLGHHYISIDFPIPKNSGEFIIRDNGSGKIASTWDHFIYINKSNKENQIIYTDQVKIEARILTLPVYIFAFFFYKWRQYRWKKLVRLSFKPLKIDYTFK